MNLLKKFNFIIFFYALTLINFQENALLINYSLASTQEFSTSLGGLYDNAAGSPVISLINQANMTLDLELYEMDDPEVITSIRRALSRGVLVHIVKEPKPVGASCHVFDSYDTLKRKLLSNSTPLAQHGQGADCQDQQQLVRDVNASGGRYVPFVKPDLCGENGTKNCLQHGKIVIVDSKIAMISSGNLNTTNLCDLKYFPSACNRDYSYVTADPQVALTLQEIVEADLAGHRYDVADLLTSETSKKLTVGPHSLAPLISFIESAKNHIQIENQYLKEATINAALIRAAQQGIQVDIVIESACSFGKPKPNEAKKLALIFKDFDQAGISTRMFNKKIQINGVPGYLHAKAIVIDRKMAWMGSVNGSTQAVSLNREFGIFFDQKKDVEKLSQLIESDFSNPNAESWEASLNCAENS